MVETIQFPSVSLCLFIIFVYYEVLYILDHNIKPHLKKSEACVAKDISCLKEITQVNKSTLQGVEYNLNKYWDTVNFNARRFETLEETFQKLVTAESARLKAKTSELRAQLQSGLNWGKKRRELEEQVGDVSRREAVWIEASMV